MKKLNNKYWENRAVQKENILQSKSKSTIRKVTTIYDNAIENINKEIEKIFNRYATDGKLTPADANQLLNNTESKDVIESLKQKINSIEDKEVKRELLNRINAPAYAARLTRLQAVKENVYYELKRTALEEIKIDKSSFANTYDESYYRSIFNIQQRLGISFDFALIPKEAINETLNYKLKGKNFSQRVWNNTNILAQRAQEIIETGILSGASVQKMATELDYLSLVGKSASVRLIRTETNYFMGQGELASYKEIGIDKYRYLATLDMRTSEICSALDGEEFDVDKAIAGENYPPMHPWCRSTTIAYFDNDNIGERIARNKNGETYKVPADMTYKQWKEKYVDDAISVADKRQFEKYKSILQELSPKTLEEFVDVKYNNIDKWNQFKSQFRILNRYEIDGTVSASKIIELDKVAWEMKKNGFDYTNYTGKERKHIRALKNSGNAASMDFENDIYFAHSRISVIGEPEYDSYNGAYPIVGLSNNRIFDVMDLGDGIPREDDTEAKLLEFAATKLDKDSKNAITILSEKHICESCQGVVEQFKKKFPNATVNVVSGKRGYNKNEKGTSTWKYRKMVK